MIQYQHIKYQNLQLYANVVITVDQVTTSWMKKKDENVVQHYQPLFNCQWKFCSFDLIEWY